MKVTKTTAINTTYMNHFFICSANRIVCIKFDG